jgi:phenol hydroxylase P0 protein
VTDTATMPFDPNHKYVRVKGTNRQGFVEFEFFIGSEELSVELMMPPAIFEEFCQTQQTVRLDSSGIPGAH